MWRTDSLENTLMLGKIEDIRRRGWQRMRLLDGITISIWTWVWASSGRWWRKGSLACAVHGVAKSQTWLSDWTDWITYLLRNLYAGQQVTVWTLHGTTDQLKLRNGVRQGCILSPCLFNFYAEYIIWNAGLDEAQAEIKIVRRNINNLRYADYTTLMAENKEELKSFLMKVKEKSEKDGLKLKIQKTRIMVSGPIP